MTFNWGKFSSGPYVLKATVKDNQGKEVTAEANTILFSSDDKRPLFSPPCGSMQRIRNLTLLIRGILFRNFGKGYLYNDECILR